MLSMRPRTRLAVSVLSSQIGSMTFITSAVSIVCERADDREREAPDRTLPLLGVLRVTPSRAVRRDVPLGALLKRHRLGGIELRLRTSGASMLNWIDALMTKSAGILR